ncbi:MAG: hypothetical protein HY332_18920 [Chloroflexi bacterium]|nr:hypothetical protein [Chloroflexota bacterium]
MVTIHRDTEAIRQALAAGHLTVPDTGTGYHRSMYADCPADGQPAGVWRIVREHGGEITEVTMRCSRCGTEFAARPEALYLR